jgi:HEPN domain-containing protein
MNDNIYVTETMEELYDNAEKDLLDVEALKSFIVFPEERKYSKICYSSQPAVEKLLKGYIINNNEKPVKTHDIELLLNQIISINNSFASIRADCLSFNKFTPSIRYSSKMPSEIINIKSVLNSLSKIANFPPILSLRELVSKQQHYTLIAQVFTNDHNNPKTPSPKETYISAEFDNKPEASSSTMKIKTKQENHKTDPNYDDRR